MSEPQTHLDPLLDAHVVADPQPEAEAVVDYVPFEATVGAGEGLPEEVASDLERLSDVPVELAVEIGRARMTIGETLALCPGSIITLNRLAGEPVDLLVNGKPIARGEVVVIDEEFGLRVTEVVSGGRRPRLDAQ